MLFPTKIGEREFTEAEVNLLYDGFDIAEYDAGNRQPAKAALIMDLKAQADALKALAEKVEATDVDDIAAAIAEYGETLDAETGGTQV